MLKMNGSQQGSGQVPQCNGAPQQPGRTSGRPRMPTVHEAFPYTPLSSIVPFTPDIVPAPTALPSPSPSVFSNADDVKNAKQVLEQLSAGANSAEGASNRCKQTLNDLKRLLNADTLPEYHFRTRKGGSLLRESTQNHQNQAPKLSPFAKMVMEQVNVPYRYLTPESPEPEVAKKKTMKPHGQAVNAQVNGSMAVPHATPSQPRQLVAAIPSDVSPAQRAQYQYIPASDASSGAQYQTPSSRPPHTAKIMSVEQRQKGDVAVQNLQNALGQIFAAEKQLQSAFAGDDTIHANRIFTTRDTDEGPVTTLQVEAQSKLDLCVAKAVSTGRLLDIDVQHLAGVQRICQDSVTAAQQLSLFIGEDWSEEDTADWLTRISAAESGLAAARTIVRIMNGAPHQKELHSEDYLKEVLQMLKITVETCIIPIVEEPASSRERIKGERGAPPSSKFVTASNNRKALLPALNGATKCMRLLGDLSVKIELDETTISSVEYLCKTLIFAENTSSEKDSALGIQNFESMRRCAMDVLAKLFTKYEAQRQFIFDEILISLEKLPATKQSARQYRLPDSKPIQLVSALLMRLVQTSATQNDKALKLRSKDEEIEGEDEDADGETEDDSEEEDEDEIKVSPAKRSNASTDLASLTKPLHEAASANARYIANVLLTRALSTSKSSEEPYRKLLDIFTEDFLNVLGSSDWPAAELLLRALLMSMIGIIERGTSSAPARTLALELLGVMGSGILELQITARDTARNVDAGESAVAQHLCGMVKQLEAGTTDTNELLSFDGPYRIVIEYLETKGNNDDPQLQTARGYHLMDWGFAAAGGREGSADSEGSDVRSSQDLRSHLRNMLRDPHWLDEHSSMQRLSTSEGRLAAMIVTLNSTFCKAFNRIFGTLLSSMSSDHSSSTVKSRALKSVVTLLEKDASILERNSYVLQHIFRCASDSSPLVRDSALGLIDKCLSLQPGLSATAYKSLIERTHDAAVGVRKRAMRMLKDIYLRTNSNAIRSAIANAIIARIHDSEENIIEIARTTMEEIWLHPLYGMKLEGERAIQAKLAFGSHAALMIQTVEQSDEIMEVLESLLKRLLTKSKASQANGQVCKTIIAVLFDGIIDNTEIPGGPAQSEILRTLTVFAKACPTLFTPSQLERLEPYTQNLTNTDDLEVYRSVITILRHVVPYQPVMNKTFLQNMQTTLLVSVTKLQKSELNEVAPCLWTISTMIDNTNRLANTIMQVVFQISQLRSADLTADLQKKLIRLVRIAGEFGNACDFDKYLSDFKRRFDWFNGDSVPGLIVEIICPFTSPKRPLEVRMECLDAVCTISQAWPKQFLRADVLSAFEIVFGEREQSLEEVLLTSLRSFFKAQETPEETDEELEHALGVEPGERLGKTYVASDQDGASTSLAQRFLPDMLKIALASNDERAYAAARLAISINKQGLVHPKDSAPTIVALETCPSKAVAGEAFKEHKSQHQKHETMFEKEYIRAVQRTFEYQYEVIGQPTGFIGQPPTSKMHFLWEVLKIGKAQVRKKFLGNMAQKLDFDSAMLKTTKDQQQQFHLVKFCTDNLAFFEYDKVDDILHLLTSLDRVFAGTGSAVAQAVESEVLKLRVEGLDALDGATNYIPAGMPPMIMPNGMYPPEGFHVGAMPMDSIQVGPAPLQAPMQQLPIQQAPMQPIPMQRAPVDIDPERLQQLAVSAQILTLVWETRTFLLRVWNMQKHMKTKKLDKDSNRTPNRATNAPSLTEAYLRRIKDISVTIDGSEAQRATCSAFVELISVDNEVKVASDEDADAELANGYDTPSESSSRKSPSVPGSGRGRKRKVSSASNTPRKRGRPSLGKRKSTGGSKYAEGSDEEDGGWD